jgi:hypothetical protein
MIAGRSIRGSGEVSISKTTTSSSSSEPTRTVCGKILQQLVGPPVKNLCTHWDPDYDIFAAVSRSPGSFTVLPTAGRVFRVIAKMQQCIKRRISDQPNISACTSVATGRTTPRDKFFAAEGRNTIAPITPLNANPGTINKH